MFKKIVRDFLILFGLATLWASTSRPVMQYLCDLRDGNKWWCTYPCLNGDLVSMSYLDLMKKFNPGPELSRLKKADYLGPKQTELYLHGDSYTWHMTDSFFAGLTGFHYINRTHGLKFHLDTSRNNVMVIEISERYMRAYFSSLQMLDEVVDTGGNKVSSGMIYPGSPYMAGKNSGRVFFPVPSQASFVATNLIDVFFNKYINQNLQCNLFNYQAIIPLFESKAALNYTLFNRASGDVVISNDRNYLFLRETVSRTDVGSSYEPINKGDIKVLVDDLNVIYDHYRSIGFREVYLSVIPNSATILQPDGYNNLIPQVQNAVGLRMRIIDAYSLFRQSTDVLYMPGDTHWNNKGRQKWLDLVNEILIKTGKTQ